MAQLQKKLSVFGIQLTRQISTTACVCGKRNFRKFPLYNKRGSKLFKAQQFKKPDPNIPIYGLYLRIYLSPIYQIKKVFSYQIMEPGPLVM
jgi:hypothetical protein